MRLLSLHAQNFLSLGDVRIEFAPGMHYISGVNHDMAGSNNGVGKSAIWEAVFWSLFGSLLRAKSVSDDIVNRSAGAGTHVRIEIDVAGTTLAIDRYRKHEHHGNALHATFGAESLTCQTVSETQGRIDRLLPLSRLALEQGVVIGQGMLDRFIDLSEAQKYSLLREVSGLDGYDSVLARAKSLHTAATSDARDADARAQEHKARVSRLDTSIESARKLVAEVESDRERAQQWLRAVEADMAQRAQRQAEIRNEVETALSVLTAQIASCEEQREPWLQQRQEIAERTEASHAALKSARDELQQRIDRVREQMAEMREKHKQFVSTAIAPLEQRLHAVQAQTQAERQTLERERAQLQRLGDVCATCGQPVSDHKASRLSAISGDLERIIASGKEAAGVVERQLSGLRLAEKDINEKASVLVMEERDLLTKQRSAESSHQTFVSALSRQRADIDEALRNYDVQIAAMRARYSQQEVFLRNAMREQDDHAKPAREELSRRDAAVAHARGRLDALTSERAEASAQHAEASARQSTHRRYADHCKLWLTQLPVMCAALLDDVVRFLNARLAAYSRVLSDGELGLSLEQYQHGSGPRIRANISPGAHKLASGGERRRLDLAVYFGIADLISALSGVRCGLLVCDEVTDSLSPDGVRAVLTLLRQRADAGEAVYVISHDPAIRHAATFDSTLWLEKRGGVANAGTVLAA